MTAPGRRSAAFPVSGHLSLLTRVAFPATFCLSAVAAILDFGLHAEEAVVFAGSRKRRGRGDRAATGRNERVGQAAATASSSNSSSSSSSSSPGWTLNASSATGSEASGSIPAATAWASSAWAAVSAR